MFTLVRYIIGIVILVEPNWKSDSFKDKLEEGRESEQDVYSLPNTKLLPISTFGEG